MSKTIKITQNIPTKLNIGLLQSEIETALGAQPGDIYIVYNQAGSVTKITKSGKVVNNKPEQLMITVPNNANASILQNAVSNHNPQKTDDQEAQENSFQKRVQDLEARVTALENSLKP